MKPSARLFLFLTFLLFLASTSVFAIEETVNPNVASDERNHDESWYWGFNLGGGRIKYMNDAVDASVDTYRNSSAFDHVSVYFDLYFMWPLEGYRTALGVSAGGLADFFRNDATNTDFNITTSLLAFTAQHWFSSNIGDGLFGRADVGLAASKQTNRIGNVTIEDDSHRGLGFRLGLGYSILLSNETRMPLMLQWQRAKTANNTGSNALIFTVGLLF